MKLKTLLLSSALALIAAPSFAQSIEVKNPWVRPTVPGQKGTGGFAVLTSKEGAQLVGLSAAVAGVSELHEMKVDAGGTMRMSAIKSLDLPAGKAVELKPGGLHLMLMDLKTALPKDTTIPIALQFKGNDGIAFTQTVSFTVTPRAPSSEAGAHSGAQKH